MNNPTPEQLREDELTVYGFTKDIIALQTIYCLRTEDHYKRPCNIIYYPDKNKVVIDGGLAIPCPHVKRLLKILAVLGVDY